MNIFLFILFHCALGRRLLHLYPENPMIEITAPFEFELCSKDSKYVGFISLQNKRKNMNIYNYRRNGEPYYCVGEGEWVEVWGRGGKKIYWPCWPTDTSYIEAHRRFPFCLLQVATPYEQCWGKKDGKRQLTV